MKYHCTRNVAFNIIKTNNDKLLRIYNIDAHLTFHLFVLDNRVLLQNEEQFFIQ